jgi:hypothetical protein
MAFLSTHGRGRTRFIDSISKYSLASALSFTPQWAHVADASSLPNSSSASPLFPLLMAPDPRGPAVRLDGEGWTPAETDEPASGLTLAARGRVAEDVFITPVNLSQIIGEVRDDKGKPVADARVTLETLNGEHLEHTFTDARGRYRFTGIPADTYLVVVEKIYYDTALRVVTAGGPAGSADIVLTYDVNAVIGKNRAPWDVNTSGPQYTGTADVEPAGSWYFEPWVYDQRTHSQGTSSYHMPERIAIGLGHNMEFDYYQTIVINHAGYPTTPYGVHASDWGFGNAHMQLKYQFVKDEDTYTPLAWPSISMAFDLFVPTGNYTTDLKPSNYGTDQFGNGTIDEALNFYIRKRFKPFEFYFEVGDIIANPARVGPGYTFNNGIEQVPPGVYERMVDGNYVWFGAALEHVLDTEHGIGYVLELTGATQTGSSLLFGRANAPEFSYLWGVPSIEFNWPSSGPLVVTWGFGLALPIAQSNTPRTYTAIGTVTFYWNGGGPR